LPGICFSSWSPGHEIGKLQCSGVCCWGGFAFWFIAMGRLGALLWALDFSLLPFSTKGGLSRTSLSPVKTRIFNNSCSNFFLWLPVQITFKLNELAFFFVSSKGIIFAWSVSLMALGSPQCLIRVSTPESLTWIRVTSQVVQFSVTLLVNLMHWNVPNTCSKPPSGCFILSAVSCALLIFG